MIDDDDMNVEKLSISNCVDKNYHFVKHISRTYHQAKIGLFTTLKESNLRTWVPAPIDVDQFPILSSTLPQPPSSLSMQQQESEQNNDDSTTNNNNNDEDDNGRHNPVYFVCTFWPSFQMMTTIH